MPPTHIFLTFIRLTNYKKEKEGKKRKRKERERKIEISFNERSITGARCTRVVCKTHYPSRLYDFPWKVSVNCLCVKVTGNGCHTPWNWWSFKKVVAVVSIEATRNLSQTQRSIWGCNGPRKKLRYLFASACELSSNAALVSRALNAWRPLRINIRVFLVR